LLKLSPTGDEAIRDKEANGHGNDQKGPDKLWGSRRRYVEPAAESADSERHRDAHDNLEHGSPHRMSGHIAGTPDAPVRSAAILTLRGRMGRQVVDELVSGGHGQHQDSAGERQRRR
jgi:hypothetical protein